jgi:hypothetical protein
MADIVPAYTPTDGTKLNPSSFMANVHSTTDGVSVYGEMNGHLQDANFHADFRVQAQHIRPNEGFMAKQSPAATETLDFVDLLFGTDASEMTDVDWLVVPGASTRVYVPYNAKAVVYNVSAFVTNQRQREILDPNPEAEEYGGPEMYLRMRIDGSPVSHSLRSFPYTAYPTTNPGIAKGFTYREHILTHPFDLVHMALAGHNWAAKGYHDVAIEILIPRTRTVEAIYPMYEDRTHASPKTVNHSLRHRLRFGIRKAFILAL